MNIIRLSYTFATALVILFTTQVSVAQKSTKTKPKAVTEKGALFFEQTFISLGSVQDKQEPIKLVYKYRNIGKGKTTITNIKPDCGCSKPKWDNKPIAFDQKGEIEVYFFPKELSGNQTKTITVFTDGEPNVYYLKFNVFVDDVNARVAKAYPSKQGNTLFDSYEVKFPAILNHASDSLYRTIYNPTAKTIKIYGIDAPKYMTVTKYKDHISPNSEVGFKFKYKANEANDYGKKLDEVIVHTDDSLEPKKKFLVRANIVEDFDKLTEKEKANPPIFEAITPMIDLGQVKTQSTHTVTFTITNKGKTPLFVRKIFSTCGCTTTDFDYSKPIKKGKKATITVTYNTNYDIGKVEKQISLITNTPNQTLHNLVLKANIVYTKQ
jgi:hypothetical protein